MTTAPKPRTDADRQRAIRDRRPATVYATLTAAEDAALRRILTRTGETRADWVRRMIVEQAK
jgi:hypothetical protein